ncbi:hypothetical protein NHX12_016951 [Muraenolepis orangiensis]|uniref:DUF4430 domain-containing protein n=1 Tax=Muraenolepis orangiensis TaxID=630683 RepID=A0A9Q0D633_9TELE|nr:hypothetical protein NHX12_016951 [Muraenolepis orangiensis]
MVSCALLWSLLVISLSGTLAQNAGQLTFDLVVKDNQPDGNKMMYMAQAAPGGSLFGAMTRLSNSNHSDFTFTSSEHIDYGAYLESVNGLFGSFQDHTYWELLVQTANGIIRSSVGISCYIPQANEVVILNFTTW